MGQHRQSAALRMRQQSLWQPGHHGRGRNRLGRALHTIEIVELRTAAAVAGEHEINHAMHLRIDRHIGRIEIRVPFDLPVAGPILADQRSL